MQLREVIELTSGERDQLAGGDSVALVVHTRAELVPLAHVRGEYGDGQTVKIEPLGIIDGGDSHG